MTTQFLPSIRDSETVICGRCKTRQCPRDGACVRCHCGLKLEYLNLEVSTLLNPRTVQDDKQLARSIGVLLRSLRKRRGLSQSLLATRAAGCISRACLSKSECGHVLLPLGKLLPVAKALGLTAVILRYETTSSLAPNQSNDRC
jgi:hypothetical protein